MQRYPKRRGSDGWAILGAALAVLILNLLFWGALLVGALFILRAFDVL